MAQFSNLWIVRALRLYYARYIYSRENAILDGCSSCDFFAKKLGSKNFLYKFTWIVIVNINGKTYA